MLEQVTSAADDFVNPGGSHFPSIMSTTATPSPTANVSSSQSHSATALALGISLAVVATIVFGGLAFYFVRRRMWQKKAQERAEETRGVRAPGADIRGVNRSWGACTTIWPRSSSWDPAGLESELR